MCRRGEILAPTPSRAAATATLRANAGSTGLWALRPSYSKASLAFLRVIEGVGFNGWKIQIRYRAVLLWAWVTMTANSALVSDVCAAALRAFYNAPQRGR